LYVDLLAEAHAEQQYLQFRDGRRGDAGAARDHFTATDTCLPLSTDLRLPDQIWAATPTEVG